MFIYYYLSEIIGLVVLLLLAFNIIETFRIRGMIADIEYKLDQILKERQDE